MTHVILGALLVAVAWRIIPGRLRFLLRVFRADIGRWRTSSPATRPASR